MGTYTFATLNTAIEDTLSTATGITRSQDLSEITDNIPEGDLPLLQVYPQSWEGMGETAKNSFGSVSILQQKQFVFHADIYVSTLTNFSQGMTKFVTIAQAITDVLDAQKVRPLFGDSQQVIQNFKWSAERVVFEYSNQKFIGIRVTITLEIF